MKGLIAFISFLLAVSSAKVIEPRKPASCQDACGKQFAGKTMTPDKSTVLSDCNSFLATTVLGPVTTLTATVPLAVFGNQTIDESTRVTITPLQNATQASSQPAIPTYVNHLGCQSTAGVDIGADFYTSLCQCAGAKATQIEVPASTVTVTIQAPTQVSSFKIRAVFENGTYNYLSPRPYNVVGGEWVAAFYPANTTMFIPTFSLQNGTLMHKTMQLMEYERVLPSLDDGTPQLIWFVRPKEERMQNSRPFKITPKYLNNEIVYPIVPQEGGAGIEYTEFFICESCGNQLYITTSAWKDGYMKRIATDTWDRYDWVELYAEPEFQSN